MIELRPERAGDAAAIRAVHLAAFPSALEADLVEQLKADGDASISLVAADDRGIVGHILFSRMDVEADGERLTALGLAPVAVIPERQRQGIGGRLIEAGLREARSQGIDIVFLVGEPAYYSRFGFDAGVAAPFASPYAGPYLQALALRDGYRAPSGGRADYPRAFDGLE